MENEWEGEDEMNVHNKLLSTRWYIKDSVRLTVLMKIKNIIISNRGIMERGQNIVLTFFYQHFGIKLNFQCITSFFGCKVCNYFFI